MNRILIRSALMGTVAALTCATALAADPAGMRDVTAQSGYSQTITLQPQTADGSGVELAEGAYPGAEKISVTYSGAQSGKQYLVIVQTDENAPNETNIAYIDQKEAGSNVNFIVYPGSPDTTKTYYIYMASDAEEGITTYDKVATFQYYEDNGGGGGGGGTNTGARGDLNGNGRVDISDAMAIINHLVRGDAVNETAADLNSNGRVDISDAMMIINHLVRGDAI